VLTSILSARLAEPILYGLLGGVVALFTDVHNIAGSWRATWSEPIDNAGTLGTAVEDLELHQLGRFVWGTGRVSDTAGHRRFRYTGHIKRNAFLARYTPVGRNGSLGSGALQASINERADTLTGWCIWHDRDSQQVESSAYAAAKNP
jgi:hypothetical protein